MNIPTLDEEWQRFRDAAYPPPPTLSGVQARETRLAFLSGALTAFALMNRISDLPEADAVAELAKLHEETVTSLRTLNAARDAEAPTNIPKPAPAAPDEYHCDLCDTKHPRKAGCHDL